MATPGKPRPAPKREDGGRLGAGADPHRTEPRNSPRHSQRHQDRVARGEDPRDPQWPDHLDRDAASDDEAGDGSPEMIEPTPCDRCGEAVERLRMAYDLVVVGGRWLDFRGRYCPRCAGDLLRRRRFGRRDSHALSVAAGLLLRRFGEPVRTIWLQGDDRLAAVLCRRRVRLRCVVGRSSEVPPEVPS